MKKLIIILLSLIFVYSACSRSQFSTTTRHSRNGKVTYVNHYPIEKNKRSNTKSYKRGVREIINQKNISTAVKADGQNPDENLIYNSVQTPSDENIVASTSESPTSIIVNKSRMTQNTESTLSKKNNDNPSNVYANNIAKKNAKARGLTPNTSPDNTRNIERKALIGFIFSILGWVPFAGFILGFIGVMFCGISLHKFNTDSQYRQYRGRGLALAGLIIGITGLIFNILLAIYFIFIYDFWGSMSFTL